MGRGEAIFTSELLDYIAGDGAPGDTPAAVTDDRSPAVRRSPPAHDTVLLGSLSQREQGRRARGRQPDQQRVAPRHLAPLPSGHVEHALRKLNLTRRTQMAAAISGSRLAVRGSGLICSGPTSRIPRTVPTKLEFCPGRFSTARGRNLFSVRRWGVTPRAVSLHLAASIIRRRMPVTT